MYATSPGAGPAPLGRRRSSSGSVKRVDYREVSYEEWEAAVLAAPVPEKDAGASPTAPKASSMMTARPARIVSSAASIYATRAAARRRAVLSWYTTSRGDVAARRRELARERPTR